MNRDANLRSQYIARALGDLGATRSTAYLPRAVTSMQLAPAPQPTLSLPPRFSTSRTPVSADVPSTTSGPVPVGTKKPEAVASSSGGADTGSDAGPIQTDISEAIPWLPGKGPAQTVAAIQDAVSGPGWFAPGGALNSPGALLALAAGAGILLYVLTKKR